MSRATRQPLAVVLTCLALAIGPGLADAAGLFEPELVDDERYYENYSAMVDLDEGGYLQLQVVFSNAGPGSGHAGCRAILARPGQPVWRANTTVARRDLRYEPGPAPRLVLGDLCLVRAGEPLVIDARFDQRLLRLELQGRARPVTPPRAQAAGPDSFYAHQVLLPAAPARLRLLQGASAEELRGVGYLDRSRSTFTPARLARRWVRLRVLRAPAWFLAAARFPADGGAVQAWSWHAAQDQPAALAAVAMTATADAEHPAGLRVTVALPDGTTVVAQATQLLSRSSPMEELWYGAVLRPWLGNPVGSLYRAQVTLGAAPPVPGLLELTQVAP